MLLATNAPALLLGAHGVAPSKNSLARRVARVLDGKSVRGPVARSFALGVFSGAVLVAAPLAALTLTPAAPKVAKATSPRIAASEPKAAYQPVAPEVPTDLPHIIVQGVSTSVTTAVAAAAAVAPEVARRQQEDFRVVAPNGASVEQKSGVTVSRSPSGASVTMYPPDARGRRKVVAVAQNGATAVSYVDANDIEHRIRDSGLDAVIEAKAVGVTPEYIAAMRAAVPRLGNLQFSDFSGLRAVGVTPEYARALVAAGFPSITADELMEARSVGVTGAYVSAMRSAGIQGDLDDFVQLRAVGVDPAFAARVKASGIKVRSADDLVELRALGVVKPPQPPRAPPPPRGWNPDPDPGG